MIGRIVRKSSVEFAKKHENIFTEYSKSISDIQLKRLQDVLSGTGDEIIISMIQLKRLQDVLSEDGDEWSLLTNKFDGNQIAELRLVTRRENKFISFKFTNIANQPLWFSSCPNNITSVRNH